MTTLILRGPWAAILAGGDDPENFQYAIVKDGLASSFQAETFLRKNHPDAFKSGMAFPFDVEKMVREAGDQYRIKGIDSEEKLKELAATISPGSKTKN